MTGKKRRRHPILRAVFTRLGRWFAALNSDHNPSQLFLFFNHAIVGGADLVHAQIAQALRDRQPWVYFTLPTWPQPFAERFPAEARIDYVGRRAKSTAMRFFWQGYLAAIINRHTAPVLLGSQSRFYLEMLPLLKPHVKRFDLMHCMFTLEHFALPYVPLLDRRVFIAATVMKEMAELYRAEGIDEALAARMCLIENMVEVPPTFAPKPDTGPLQVLFVGRGSTQKRIHLIGRIASACKAAGINAEFTLVGDVDGWLEKGDEPACRRLGVIKDPQQLYEVYAGSHVLLLTSSFEGFPLVGMEAMARGVVPVSTNVGGMADHVIDGQTGLLLPPQDEAAVVQSGVAAIARLAADRALLATMAAACHARALKYFGAERFNRQWRDLLIGAESVDDRPVNG